MEELITLDHEQVKAFNSLKRAIKKCVDSGVMFYVVLDDLHAVNGKEVACIEENADNGGMETTECLDLTYCVVDNGFCSFSDDTHYATLKI